MKDPYQSLGKALVHAAQGRQPRGATFNGRARLSRRVNAALLVFAIALAGGALALAESGLLNGSPVAEPQGAPTPSAGTGVPSVRAGAILALRAADPEGGLPWGMRVVHTTRGERCVQIGRVQDGELGQLGIDGAFHDDGRFHPLTANTLPNFTSGYADITCLLPGEAMIGRSPAQDRNAEWGVGALAKRPVQDLRSITWGLLGSHAVSVAYKTSAGVRTTPVSPGSGAFMIVQALHGAASTPTIGGFESGSIAGHFVGLDPAATTLLYRFGSSLCRVGALVPASKRCPAPPPTPLSSYQPTHSLHEPVAVKAVSQTHAICDAEYLLYPCYRAEVEFRAPYAITSAGSEYEISARSRCHNATPSDWGIDRNVTQGEVIRSLSLGEFNCLSDEFEVEYTNQAALNSSARSSHKSVIVGRGRLLRAAPVSPPG